MSLLQFVQSGFSYATDDAFHGFEKPYFLEENLFYPKNDCEDRAIFYTYLLWNALGVENQLLCFPDMRVHRYFTRRHKGGEPTTMKGRDTISPTLHISVHAPDNVCPNTSPPLPRLTLLSRNNSIVFENLNKKR